MKSLIEKFHNQDQFPRYLVEMSERVESVCTNDLTGIDGYVGTANPPSCFAPDQQKLLRALITYAAEDLGYQKEVEEYWKYVNFIERLNKMSGVTRDPKNLDTVETRRIFWGIHFKYNGNANPLPSSLRYHSDDWEGINTLVEKLATALGSSDSNGKPNGYLLALEETKRLQALMRTFPEYQDDTHFDLVALKIFEEMALKVFRLPEWLLMSHRLESPDEIQSMKTFQMRLLEILQVPQHQKFPEIERHFRDFIGKIPSQQLKPSYLGTPLTSPLQMEKILPILNSLREELGIPPWFTWSSEFSRREHRDALKELQAFVLAAIDHPYGTEIMAIDEALHTLRAQVPALSGQKEVFEMPDIQIALATLKDTYSLMLPLSFERGDNDLSSEVLQQLRNTNDFFKWIPLDPVYRDLDRRLQEILNGANLHTGNQQVQLAELITECLNNWLLDLLLTVLIGVGMRGCLSNFLRRRGGVISQQNYQSMIKDIWASSEAMDIPQRLSELSSLLQPQVSEESAILLILKDLLRDSQNLSQDDKARLALSLRVPFLDQSMLIDGVSSVLSFRSDKLYLQRMKVMTKLKVLAARFSQGSLDMPSFTADLENAFASTGEIGSNPGRIEKQVEIALENVGMQLFRYLSGKNELPSRGFTPLLMKTPFGPLEGEEVEERAQYFQGDDIRKIDWAAYGRTDRWYVKRKEKFEGRPLALVISVPGLLGKSTAQSHLAEVLYVLMKKKIPLGEIVLVSSPEHLLPIDVTKVLKDGKIQSIRTAKIILRKLQDTVLTFSQSPAYRGNEGTFPENEWYGPQADSIYRLLWESSSMLLQQAQKWDQETLQIFLRNTLRRVLQRTPSICSIGFTENADVFRKEFGAKVWMEAQE